MAKFIELEFYYSNDSKSTVVNVDHILQFTPWEQNGSPETRILFNAFDGKSNYLKVAKHPYEQVKLAIEMAISEHIINVKDVVGQKKD